MSVYLLNLRFDAANAANGNFDSSTAGSNLNTSQVWLQYVPGGVPAGVQDSFAPLATALNNNDWRPLSPSTTPQHFNSGDYLVVRIYPVSSPANTLVKVTVVFGRGTTSPNVFGNLQSPFSQNGTALPLLENATVTGVASPDGVGWTYCLGKVNGDPNQGVAYAMNVGAAVSPSVGPVARFAGTIPIHTGGGGTKLGLYDVLQAALASGTWAVVSIVTFVFGSLALWRAQRILTKARELQK